MGRGLTSGRLGPVLDDADTSLGIPSSAFACGITIIDCARAIMPKAKASSRSIGR